MTHAIKIHQTGGPEVLSWEEIDLDAPGANEVTIKHTACGLNYIDVYGRTGMYPVGDLPAILGMEGVGVVEAVGSAVSGLSTGQRVAYPMHLGSYCERRNIDASKLISIPDNIDDHTTAAMMLKGLTAHYLLFRTYAVKPGDNILVYAAAGGVGLILCQWAKILGANIIGCVGSDAKAELARANGCDHVIMYRDEDIPTRVKEITGGEGVAVAYDSIGKATFDASIDSLKPFGTYVSYGNASGKVEPFSPAILAPKGSLYVTRPTLGTHISTRELLVEGADRLINAVSSGQIHIQVNQTYQLQNCAEAHRALEARETTGSTILTV